jgi:hypothetical protein
MSDRISAAVYSAYKCNDCKSVRAVTMIPAVIDGVVEDDQMTAQDCSVCYSTDIETLFETKDPSEGSAYLKVILLTTNSKGKHKDLESKIKRQMQLLRKWKKDE